MKTLKQAINWLVEYERFIYNTTRNYEQIKYIENLLCEMKKIEKLGK